MPNDARFSTPVKNAVAHFWTAYQLMLLRAATDPSPTDRTELTKHMVKHQTTYEGGFYQCARFIDVHGLLTSCLWQIDLVVGIDRLNYESTQPATTSDIARAHESFNFLLNFDYVLRDFGYVKNRMPFLDSAMDNKTADMIDEAFDRMKTRQG